MLMYASNHPTCKALLKTKNAQGLTPFNLAAKLARSDIFTKMLEVNEIVIFFFQTDFNKISIDLIL